MVKKLVLKGLLFITLIIITFAFIFFGITKVVPPQFTDSYNYMINDKYDNLIKTKSPKIIFISGSSGTFGINSEMIKKETGIDCTNLALHAGFGMKFQTEISKGNISKGDIVVISYEYAQWSGTNLQAELVVTGIDNNIKMYKYVPKKNYIDITKYFPTYIFKKLDSAYITPMKFDGVYSRKAFNKRGDLVFKRSECIMPSPISIDKYGKILINKSIVSDEIIEYVNDFNNYVKSRQATLLVSFPPALKDVVVSSKNEIIEFQSYLDKKLDAPIISNAEDYVFKREYFYNSIYHLNDNGELKRTKLLTRDINKYLATIK